MPGGTALFGSAASRGQTKNLVEFKAGKMTLKDKMVHPDKRKGLVYIYQSDDSLMHFCWKDRSNNSVEEDLIIFPDDVEFKKVPQCTTGRVYMLKFKSSSRIFFFWLQEPKTDKDEDNCRKVNEILNNPPALGSQRSGGATPDGDLQNLLSNMSQQQLMQLFGGVSGGIGGLSSLLGTMNSPRSSSGTAASTGPPSVASTPATSTPSSATAAAKTPVTPANPIPKPARPAAPVKAASSASSVGDRDNLIQLSQLQNYFIQNFENSSQASTDTASGVDLSTSVNQESLQAILNNPAFVRELQRHLPAFGDSGHEDLRSTLASPQFQQALSMFSTALQSGQLGPVVSQFQVGNDAVVAANQGNMEEFVRALQAASISSSQVKDDDKETKQDEKKPKKDEEEDMNLD